MHVLFTPKGWDLSEDAWAALERFGDRGSIRSAEFKNAPAILDALSSALLIEPKGDFHTITAEGRRVLNARRRAAA